MSVGSSRLVPFAALLTLALVPWPAQSQDSVIVPNVLANRDGSTNLCWPFSCRGGGSSRHQQIFHSGELAGSGGEVDTIAFRLNCPGAAFTAPGLNVEVWLAHTTVAPNLMSGQFSANESEAPVQVLPPTTVDFASAGISQGCPASFEIVLDVGAINAFTYNGVDNLLMDLRVHQSAPNIFFLDAHNEPNITSRVYANGPADSTNGTYSTLGLVTEFTFAAPEVEIDSDSDGVLDLVDNCIDDPNPLQLDYDMDGEGDVCDADDDNDGVADIDDNCVLLANSDQTDRDRDGYGDACVPPGTLAKNVSLGLAPAFGPGSRVHKDVVAGDHLYVGADSRIDKNVSIGNNVTIGDNVIIEKDVIVGDNVIIGDGSVIAIGSILSNDVIIGDNVRVEAGVFLGDEGAVGDDSQLRRQSWVGQRAGLGRGVRVGMKATVADDSEVPDGTSIGNNAVFP